MSFGAPITFSLIATLATLFASGYSSLQSPISELALQSHPYPWAIKFGFISYGLMVQGLGPGLAAATRGRGPRLALWSCLLVYGAGGVAAGWFITGGTATYALGVSEGDLHGFAAWVTLAAIFALMLTSAFAWKAQEEHRVMGRTSIALVGLTLVAVLVFLAVPEDVGLRGVFQRGFFITTMAWVLAASVHVRRVQRDRF